MMEETDIAGGIALKLLLAGIVVAGGVVGALGVAPVTAQAGAGGLADDSTSALMFPIDNATLATGAYGLSIDGKGNDPSPLAAFPIDNVTMAFPIDNVTMAFPIDNVTMAFPIDNVSVSVGFRDATGADRGGHAGTGSTGASPFSLAYVEAPDELPQDMDPY